MSPVAPFLAPERDELWVPGRAKRSGVDYYTLPGVAFTAVGSGAAGGNNRDTYSSFFVSTPIRVDQLAFEVTTAATDNMRIGLYRADRDWQPRSGPLCDSGDIDLSTLGVKTYTPSSALFLSSGRYLTVYNKTATGAPSCRHFEGRVSTPLAAALGGSATSMLYRFSVTRTHAAFPTPGTLWDTQDAGAVIRTIILLRVSAP